MGRTLMRKLKWHREPHANRSTNIVHRCGERCPRYSICPQILAQALTTNCAAICIVHDTVLISHCPFIVSVAHSPSCIVIIAAVVVYIRTDIHSSIATSLLLTTVVPSTSTRTFVQEDKVQYQLGYDGSSSLNPYSIKASSLGIPEKLGRVR